MRSARTTLSGQQRSAYHSATCFCTEMCKKVEHQMAAAAMCMSYFRTISALYRMSGNVMYNFSVVLSCFTSDCRTKAMEKRSTFPHSWTESG